MTPAQAIRQATPADWLACIMGVAIIITGIAA
jgi:hypothetical protein